MLDTEITADISISIQVKAKQAEIVPCEAVATITSISTTLNFFLCSTQRHMGKAMEKVPNYSWWSLFSPCLVCPGFYLADLSLLVPVLFLLCPHWHCPYFSRLVFWLILLVPVLSLLGFFLFSLLNCPFWSLSVPVFPLLSLSVPFYPCWSLSVLPCLCMSLSAHVCPCLYFYVPVCSCSCSLSLALSYIIVSCVTNHVSCVTRHMLHVAFHLPPVTIANRNIPSPTNSPIIHNRLVPNRNP